MRVTKLSAGASVFGQPIEKGYSILSSVSNFFLYLSVWENGNVGFTLTSADHRELPFFLEEAIAEGGWRMNSRITANFTFDISPLYDIEELEGMEGPDPPVELDQILGVLMGAVLTQEDPDVPATDFPLKAILQDSLYYPSSATDGGIIKYCNERFRDDLILSNHINSFVYADYALGFGDDPGDAYLQARLNDFRGYHVLFSKELKPEDLLPQGELYMPPGIDWERYDATRVLWTPFARWTVYELDDYDDTEHGPERFSLLFIGGEGIATYSGLYLSRGITPRALAIIQPGHGFGFNWTDFGDPEGPMAEVVRHGRSMPEYIFSGGMDGGGIQYLRWPGYRQIGTIHPYRTDDYTGTVLIYKFSGE